MNSLRRIHLHGFLGEKYGAQHDLAVESTAEAVRALCVNFKDFREDFWPGYFRIVRGDPETGMHIDEETVHFQLGSADLHFIPVPSGGKDGGGGKAIVGAIILVAAIVLAPFTGGSSLGVAGMTLGPGGSIAATGVAAGGLSATAFTIAGATVTYGNIAMFGAMMALQGAAQMLSPQPNAPETASRERPDQRPSFVFNGAVNTTEQGGPVPPVYGRMRVGSNVISASLEVEQI